MFQRDEDLILAYQEGNINAMAELFARYKKPVMNYAIKLLANRADAEDVVSDVFVVLFYQKYVPQPNAKFSTWLYQVAHNACISRMRNKKKWFSLFSKKNSEDEVQEWDIPDPRILHSEDIAKKEIVFHLKKAIGRLPAEQKEVIVLREFQDLSYEEIAQVLNFSIEKVKVLIFRAREHLKKDLAPYIKEASDV